MGASVTVGEADVLSLASAVGEATGSGAALATFTAHRANSSEARRIRYTGAPIVYIPGVRSSVGGLFKW